MKKKGTIVGSLAVGIILAISFVATPAFGTGNVVLEANVIDMDGIDVAIWGSNYYANPCVFSIVEDHEPADCTYHDVIDAYQGMDCYSHEDDNYIYLHATKYAVSPVYFESDPDGDEFILLSKDAIQTFVADDDCGSLP